MYWAKGGVTNFSDLKGYIIFTYPQYSIVNKDESVLLNSNIHESIGTSDYMFTGQTKAGLFESGFPLVTRLLLKGIDHDLVRKWSAKLISEDTTYFAYKKDLAVDTILNRFIGNRIMRWQFAGQIFSKEFNWKQKLFGGGFNFLNWFGFFIF